MRRKRRSSKVKGFIGVVAEEGAVVGGFDVGVLDASGGREVEGLVVG